MWRMKALTHGYVWWPNMNKVLKKGWIAVLSASYNRKPQKKHLFTDGSGLDNHRLDCTLIMQAQIKGMCI